jgi:hypothetical protein
MVTLRVLAPRFRGDPLLFGQVLQAVRDVAEYGADPIAELRIRRFRRLAALKELRV